MSETKKSTSRYPVPKIDNLPDDTKEFFLGAKEHFGFIPNVLFALAHRPDELRAFMAYNNALTNKESGLTPADREMIIVAHSNYNGFSYCVASHGAADSAMSLGQDVLTHLGLNPYEVYKLRRLFKKKDEELLPELYQIHRHEDESVYASRYQKHNDDLNELLRLDESVDFEEIDRA